MKETMYAMSLWRPWPWTFTHLEAEADPKRIENRNSKPWPWLVGKRIAFQATQRFDTHALTIIREQGFNCPVRPDAHPAGCIVFTARLRGWVEGDPATGRVYSIGGYVSAERAQALLRSRWFFGPFGYVLDNVTAVREPVPCKGRQSLFWALPADVQAEVERQTNAA